MSNLFLKIFLTGLGLTIIFFLFKKGFDFLSPVLKISARLNQFQPFIKKEIYDEPGILRASKFYVPPECQKLPPGKRNAVKQNLTRTVLQFYTQETTFRLLFILADPGMGKTCFALNFYNLIQNLPRKKTTPLVLIPLNIKDTDQMIQSVPNKKNCILFLDGLDEDIKAFNNPPERLIQLIETTKNFKKVIITGGVNFLPEHKYKAIPKGYEILLNQSSEENNLYKFQAIYIPSMSYTRAQKILSRMLPVWKANIKASILKYIYSNSEGVSPLTLGYLPDILPEQPILLSKTWIFKNIFKSWINKQHLWKNKTELSFVLRNLAVDLYLNRLTRQEEAIPEDELNTRLNEWGIKRLYPFKESPFSLVYKSPEGSVKFTHSLFLEYLFVLQLLSGDKHCYLVQLTEGMKTFLFEEFNSRQSLDLKKEFNWLKKFNVKTRELKLKSEDDRLDARPSLFKTILNKNNQFNFLKQLSHLLKNPVFTNFGWDPQLYKNLKQAVVESKSSFMELKKKRWNVLINNQQIEISQKGHKTWRIKLDDDIYDEYVSLVDNGILIKLAKTIGLDGLKKINNINQSKDFALLPNLKALNTFTFFFWEARRPAAKSKA